MMLLQQLKIYGYRNKGWKRKPLMFLLIFAFLIFYSGNNLSFEFDTPSNKDFIFREKPITAEDPSAFISEWDTTKSGTSNSDQITLPLQSDGIYKFTVNWGDGTPNQTIVAFDQAEVTHTYSAEGVYNVTINGTIVGWRFNAGGDCQKLLAVYQWGCLALSHTGTLSTGKWFRGCVNLDILAKDPLNMTEITDMSSGFYGCSSISDRGIINSWDVSTITDMSDMFRGCTNFNLEIGDWDVSSVQNMRLIFYQASTFNQNISNWNVSSVNDMLYMFSYAQNFNQDIGGWDVSSVTDMENMFNTALNFNQDLSNWNTSSVTDMNSMFYYATDFNGNLSNWDVSSVTNMYAMFNNAHSFNGDINDWNVSSVTNMQRMFYYAYDFNQSISDWDVSSVTDMSWMFCSATDFNQDLNKWNVSKVTNMNRMFVVADNFNGNIGNWNVSSVDDMGWMFRYAPKFNQNISNWDVSSVRDMSSMFFYANDFNQDIGGWNVSSVENMNSMLYYALDFDQDLGNWNISLVYDMDNIFYAVPLSIENYDSILLGWNNLAAESGIQNDVPFSASVAQFSIFAEDARENLINSYGWSITDSGLLNNASTPLSLAAIVNASNIKLSWDYPANENFDKITGYNVYRTTTEGTGYSLLSSVVEFTFIDVDVDPDIHYYYVVTAENYNGESSNSDEVTAIITPPTVSSPDDIEYREGEIGFEILWNVNDTNPSKYFIEYNGTEYISSTAWENGTININVDSLSIGNHNFTIFLNDTSGTVSFNSVMVIVNEATSPAVNHPEDAIYLVETYGNIIIWMVEDEHPDIFFVERNGSEYIEKTSWENGTIDINVDGLAVGDYNFTIFVLDEFGSMASDMVIITVMESNPPDVNNPADLNYTLGETGINITWTVGDDHPNTYYVELNGSTYVNLASWENGTLDINVDGLAVGDYNFTIYVLDDYGNMNTDTVIVSVTETNSDNDTSDDDTADDDTADDDTADNDTADDDTTDDDSETTPLNNGIIIGASGAVLVGGIITVVLLSKKKKK